MIGIGMPSSQSKIGIFRFLQMVVSIRKMGPVRATQQVQLSTRPFTSPSHRDLYRRNAVASLQHRRI